MINGSFTIDGQSYPIQEAELHLPVEDEIRKMYLSVTSSPQVWFALWGIVLNLLEDITALDGKRLHVAPNGETFEDDSLGTDIIGITDYTDLHVCHVNGVTYGYGEIQVDFKKIKGNLYNIQARFTLTDSDDDPAELNTEDFNHEGAATFTVEIDEALSWETESSN